VQRVYDLLGRAATTELTVLIVGATGTGKEEAARTLHELSRRKEGPFLAINCGAVSSGVIESELFGHERGAFTGADRVHRGHFERAQGGTLLLDEITEMSAELQVRLLRVLETRRLLRVGGASEIEVDVRVLAATNRRPEEAVAAGKLREDLLYRLDVLRIDLPPLRERGTDVDLLAAHFLAGLNQEHGTAKELSRAALARMREHDWPGNVRELRNVVQRAFVMADEVIGIDSLSLGVSERVSDGTRLEVRVGTSLPEVERRLLLATLEHFEGDKRRTAEVLGISLKTLYNRLNAYRSGV
jgi:DNA-binding NtrC family response regulator